MRKRSFFRRYDDELCALLALFVAIMFLVPVIYVSLAS